VTNRDLLVAILRHPSFLDGDTTTSFIERVAPALRREPATVEVTTAAVAASLASCHASRAAARVLTSYRPVWRNSVMPAERHTYRHGSGVGGEVVVDIQTRRDGTFDVAIDGGDFAPVRADVLSAEAVQLESGGRRTRLTVHRSGHRVWVHGPAGEVVLTQVDRFPEPEVEAVAGGLHAPMPGAVLRVDVAPGDHVAARQVLVVIEAMKMEHSIVAPVAGVVSEVRVRAGDQVGNGDLLVVLVGEEDS
jgi:propionyl-CoA carboxylase alpha chain